MFSISCHFKCQAGDHVYAGLRAVGSAPLTVTASCGGVSASCSMSGSIEDALNGCFQASRSTVLSNGEGLCQGGGLGLGVFVCQSAL